MTVVALLAGISSLRAWADYTVQGSVDAATTADSSVRVTGDESMPGDKIQFLVERVDGKAPPVRNYFGYTGPFSLRIYLPSGAGDYKIQLYSCPTGRPLCTYGPNDLHFVKNTDTRDVAFLLPSAEIQSDSPAIQTLSASITQSLTLDRDKARAIHDWVGAHIAYDTKDVFAGTDEQAPRDALAVLAARQSECDGYTFLTAALLRAAGIRTKVIAGTMDFGKPPSQNPDDEDHTWDEAFIDNRWITIDVTADAGSVDVKKKIFKFNLVHDFFDPEPDFLAKTHFKMDERSE